MKGYVLYTSNEIIDNKTVVQLFGRLENGQSFATLNTFKPYFFIRKKDLKKINLKEKPKETKLTNFAGEEVVKIEFENRTDLFNFYKKVRKEIPTYEADLKPQTRFMIEHDLLSTIEIEGDHKSADRIDRVYKNPKIKPAEYTPKQILASIDIETNKSGSELYCIGIHSEKTKKVFMVTTHKDLKNVVPCKNESDCLEKFKAELYKIDPDVITGWNVIDFDLAYLREKFKKNKIPFDIGRTNDAAKLRIESGFFKSSKIDVPGRQVLDALNLIKDPFLKDSEFMRNAKFDSFTLEDVAQAILKKGKILKGKNRHKEIDELFKKKSKASHQKLADYNILDCVLVTEILEKTKMIDLSVKRSQLTGLPLDRINGSIAAFDSLYIREAHKKGLVSPTSEYTPKEERITGGYVASKNPGIYKNVLIFDFKSLYPSIIRTFNIDPASFLSKKEKGAIKSPNNAYFKNQEGVLPSILESLHKEREKAKKDKNAFASHALKIVQNSFFGVLASPNCRYFNLKMANAITHFGQFIIKLTAQEVAKKGFDTIYSDTDSVFVKTNLPKEKALKLAKELELHINNFYDKYVEKNYKRKSNLELEFEKIYLAMMIPKVRGSGGEQKEKAAKKRYAGLKEIQGEGEVLEIVGLEAIRGDWTQAAQEFQKEILMKAFHDEPIERFIRNYIKKIRDGKLDDKLIYRKSIRKNLSEYVKTTPPHVKAARKLPKLDSKIIAYLITTDGPEPVQQIKHPIDYEHYIEKQIKPIAIQLLDLLDLEFEDVKGNSKQSKLF